MDLPARLAAAVTVLCGQRDRVLVGVDGPDAAGKTTLADRLARSLPVPALRAGVDGFHQPRGYRYRRGVLSPAGYYHDAFDYPVLLGECLAPFRDGAVRIRTAWRDHLVDMARPVTEVEVPARAALIFDGVFLLRPELRELWTLAVYLRVTPEESLRRARIRDAGLFGSVAEVDRRYRVRYLPGQALYRAEAGPEDAAHVVVDNERPGQPRIVRWAVPGDRQ